MRELRISLELPVRVWGMDKEGKPFNVQARTVEVSALGARLTGLPPVKAGEIVGVQYESLKSRFRVSWVGYAAGDRPDEVGIESLDESKCIWSTALEAQPSLKEYAAAALPDADHASLTPNRRRTVRYTCTGDVEVKIAGRALGIRIRLTDLSLGGCYAETMTPLGVDTAVDLILRTQDVVIPISGVVRTSHPSVGMGIAFTQADPTQWKALADTVARLSGDSGTGSSKDPEDNLKDAVAAMLRLVARKGLVLTEEDFWAELRKHDTAQQPETAGAFV